MTATVVIVALVLGLHVNLYITVGISDGLHAKNGVEGRTGSRMHTNRVFKVYTNVTAMSRPASYSPAPLKRTRRDRLDTRLFVLPTWISIAGIGTLLA